MFKIENRRVDRWPYILKRCHGKKVLNIGCLAANQMSELHKEIHVVAEELWGLDIYDSDIENYYKADAQNFKLSHAFDVIIVGEVIEHLSNIQGLFDSCKKHLKNEGRLIITTPNAYSMICLRYALLGRLVPNDRHHVLNFDATTLRNLLDSYISESFKGSLFYYFESNSTLPVYKLNNFLSSFNHSFSTGLLVDAEKTAL